MPVCVLYMNALIYLIDIYTTCIDINHIFFCLLSIFSPKVSPKTCLPICILSCPSKVVSSLRAPGSKNASTLPILTFAQGCNAVFSGVISCMVVCICIGRNR